MSNENEGPRFDRLDILQEYLRDVVHPMKASAHRRFTMMVFVERNLHKCDTAACAFGWAPMCPELAALGLYYNSGEVPAFEGVSGFRAAQAFFNLDPSQTDYLFEAIGDSYVEDIPEDRDYWTALDAANHIKDFIGRRGEIVDEDEDEDE